MPYRVSCPSCQSVYIVPDDSLGKKLQCSKCRQLFGVANPNPPASAAPNPPPPTTPKAAAASHMTAKPPPRPASTSPPRRDAVQSKPAPAPQPEQRKKSSRLILGAIAALLLVLGGAAAGAYVTSLYYSNQRPQAPVAEAAAATPSKPTTSSAPDATEKPNAEETALAQAAKRPAAVEEPKPASPNETPEQSSSATADAVTSKSLPPDLELVPEKETVFLSVQPAELWKNPTLAPLRRLAQTNKTIAAGLARLKQGAGLEPADIQRAVIIFWGKQDSPNSVVLATTVKPFDRPRILAMIGEGPQAEMVNGKTVLSSPKSEFALHFLNERTFLYGRAAEVKKLLERPASTRRDTSWNAVLRSAPRHPLLIGALHDIFSEDPKKQMPPALNGLKPLLDAQLAFATLDVGKELRLSLRLMFNSAEEAKEGEQAAKQGIDLAAVFLNQFAAPFKKNPPGSLPPPLAKLTAVLDDAEAAIKKAIIQTKNSVVSCDVVLASDKWPEAVAGAVELILASANQPGPSSPPKGPGPSKVREPKAVGETEAAIKKMGGSVEHENYDASKPIIGVRFAVVKLKDDDLVPLTRIATLKQIDLQYPETITDKGVKHLLRLPNLESLTIRKSLLTDEALADIKKLAKLTSLNVGDNRITDKGLVHIKEMRQLRVLELSGTEVTDAGLEHLKGLKHLVSLRLSGTKVSDKGVAELKKALPELGVFK
jgi:predicted Zn finger-like uncharacterized protein